MTPLITTLQEIEKEFDERFTIRVEKHPSGSFMGYSLWDNIKDDFSSKDGIKSFLKQSFIKYLQSEVERLEKTLIRNEEFGFCKHCPFHKGDMGHDFGKCAGHDEATSDQITHITNQIKELEV